MLPNWDFQIVEQPQQPGEYRFLQFSWKAASEKMLGITLRLGAVGDGALFDRILLLCKISDLDRG